MTQPTPDDLLARSLWPDDLPPQAASLELLAQAKAGDRDALEELVRRYQDRLQRIVLRSRPPAAHSATMENAMNGRPATP